MKWDWMIAPHATIWIQLVLDLLVPLLIVLLFRMNKFGGPLTEDDPSKPAWVRSLWKVVLAVLYFWFFSATIWRFFLSGAHK